MPKLAVLFCGFMLATSSHAATRVFYDGSESGNTNLWSQDDFRDRCSSVTSSADGVTGPYAGSRMIRCNSNGTVAWNLANRYESLKIDSFPYTNEFLLRVRVRIDQNHLKTNGSAKKIVRFFEGNEYWSELRTAPGIFNTGVFTNSYWGSADGDNTSSTSKWGEIEIYYNTATRKLKHWNDGVLIRDETTPLLSSKWYPFYLTSNFSDPHDSTNYVYFDEFEIYSDSTSGTTTTGSMADGTISASSSNQPTPLTPPSNLHTE